MIAEIQENNRKYEKIIYINNIDPNNATFLEMAALSACMGQEIQPLFALQPYMDSHGQTGHINFLEDRFDFFTVFD